MGTSELRFFYLNIFLYSVPRLNEIQEPQPRKRGGDL